MTTSESKGRFFLQNESIRITNRIDSNRELECSTTQPAVTRAVILVLITNTSTLITVSTEQLKTCLVLMSNSCNLRLSVLHSADQLIGDCLHSALGVHVTAHLHGGRVRWSRRISPLQQQRGESAQFDDTPRSAPSICEQTIQKSSSNSTDMYKQ